MRNVVLLHGIFAERINGATKSMWTVYLIQCKDDTLYTGITTDIETRITAHNAGRGAKYTRGRGPVRLVWSQQGLTQGGALKREREIKSLSREQKKRLFNRDLI